MVVPECYLLYNHVCKLSWLPDLCVLVVVRRLRSNEARSEWKSVA